MPPKFSIKSTQTSNAALLAALKLAYKRNLQFFGRAPKHVKVFECENPHEWKTHSKYYHYPFAKGLVLRDGSMVVKSQAFLKISKARYQNLIDHEMNHVFWVHFYRSKNQIWLPFWLVEAMACIVGKNHYLYSRAKLRQVMKTQSSKVARLPYRYLDSEIDSVETIMSMYSLWTQFALHICANKPARLVAFTDDLSKKRSKKRYLTLFKKHFGASPEAHLAQFTNELIGA